MSMANNKQPLSSFEPWKSWKYNNFEGWGLTLVAYKKVYTSIKRYKSIEAYTSIKAILGRSRLIFLVLFLNVGYKFS